jgi:lambda family phage portal protein
MITAPITSPVFVPFDLDKPRTRRAAARRGGAMARYDAAQTNHRNEEHWSRSDARGPNDANNTIVRETLTRRARYERDNNGNLCGLTKTLGADLIGTGPRLQLSFEDENLRASARAVEKLFGTYCDDIVFVEKLRLLCEPRPIDGEVFAQLTTNEASPNPVKLDLVVMESEQISTPFYSIKTTKGQIDGIETDRFGNRTFYHVLRYHPGEITGLGYEFDRIPARQIIHWYRPSRPGQARGVSEFASSLETGAHTRRYSQATLTKAETCANLVGVITTNAPVDEDEDEPVFEEMERVTIPEGGLKSLPHGWDAKAFDPGTNTTNYKEYVGEKHGELGRPVGAPYNVTVGNSSGYNYSSGRLDHVPYHRLVWIERHRLELIGLKKIFAEWYAEAFLLGMIPADLPPLSEWDIVWQWDAFDSIDPNKDAEAWEKLLTLQVTTRTEICAARGLRFREVVDTLAAEEAYMRSKGLDPFTGKAPPATVVKQQDPSGDTDA